MSGLTDEERNAVVFYRIQKAKDTLNEAIGIAQLKYWNAVTNRLYYACYYITSGLLISDGHNAHTHSGVIKLFGLHYVTKGYISKEQSKLYSKLFEMRQTGDYDDLYNLSEVEVQPLIEPAKLYIEEIEKLISNKKGYQIDFE
jgi:uncharacterized protein (UPF0332 family)